MFKPKSPKTITAIQFIPFNNRFTGNTDSGIMIVGFSDGSIDLTNLSNNATTTLNSNQLPSEKPAVTTIATIGTNNEYGIARCIVGFSNANVCLYSLYFKAVTTLFSRGVTNTPICHDQYTGIDLCPKGQTIPPRIAGAAIINNESIAVAFNNNTIKVVNFMPNLFQCELTFDHNKLRQIVSLNKGLKSQIPCPQFPDTAVIFTRPYQLGSRLYYVYVLTQTKELYLYSYNVMFQPVLTQPIAVNVTKIVPPSYGSTSMVYFTSDNKIWLTIPGQNQTSMEIPVQSFGTDFLKSCSAMTLSGDILHLLTPKDHKLIFSKFRLPEPDTTAIDAAPADANTYHNIGGLQAANGASPSPTSPSSSSPRHSIPPGAPFPQQGQFYNTLPTSFPPPSSSPSPNPQQSQYGVIGGAQALLAQEQPSPIPPTPSQLLLPPDGQNQLPGSQGTVYVNFAE